MIQPQSQQAQQAQQRPAQSAAPSAANGSSPSLRTVAFSLLVDRALSA